MINLIRGADPWVNGRSATLHVAASNASTLSKTNTDYLCDGVADDVQIQAAIAALPVVGGHIVLSEGTFTLAAAISIAGRLILEGQGRYNTRITQANSTGVNLIVNGAGAVVFEVQIRRLTLDGNKANNTVGKGIMGSGFQNFTLEDVRIESCCEEGLYGSGVNPQSKSWWLYNVAVAACGEVGSVRDNIYWANGAGFNTFGLYTLTSAKNGILLTSCNEINLNGVWSDQHAGSGAVISSCGQLSIGDCYFAANTELGLYLAGTCYNVRIHDNIFFLNTLTGLYIGATINDGFIHHNQMIDNADWGYRAPGAILTRCVIEGNVAQNNTSGNWSTTELGSGGFYRGNVNLDESLLVPNRTEGGVANLGIRSIQAVSPALVGATTDININIPANAMFLGASFNVNTAITGASSWSAALVGGSTTSLGTTYALTTDTKVNKLVVPEILSATTDIRLTAATANFTAGVVEAVAYYIDLTSLANV